ncbi:MAG: hypothetical protein NVS9B12_00400 [Vulcanimicrobiaceae bacterium]
MKIVTTAFMLLVAISLVGAPAGSAPPSAARGSLMYPPGGTVSSAVCKWFRGWYGAQGVKSLQIDEIRDKKKSAPRIHDALTLSFDHASWFQDPRGPGKGQCGSIWFDPAHNLAAILFYYDTYREIALFRIKSPISGVTTKDLSALSTTHRLKLGMSLQDVEAIEGPAKVIATPNGSIVHYSWLIRDLENPKITGVTFDLSALFVNNRLVAFDYGCGV